MISRLRASFSSILSTEEGPTRLATTFFSTLFATYPSFRSLFPAALDQLGRRVVQALEYVIDNLDDEDRLLSFLAQLGRDHRKYGMEGQHYSAAREALHVAVRSTFTYAIWTPSLSAAWTQLIDLTLQTMAEAAANDDLPATWGATVVEHQRRLDDVAIVRLETDTPIPYGAGQYLSVQVPQRPRMWRYLSAAIPANPYGQLEFHVRRVSGGWVSPAIVNETRVGDRWLLSSPLGGLEVDRDCGLDVLMIGSG
ncbi:MAG: globin domain-containing protein, partial [Rhodococcus sp. (in: high G+C Gram-positive bacteria)]|uniref:globin domain-containing protein n=1 Tax=Rhodococcus sp. TaxID=1831 RepID=UPI003BAFCD15